MFENRREIMQDVFLTYLPAQHFKTSRLTLNLIAPLRRETASANALLPADRARRLHQRCEQQHTRGAQSIYAAPLSPAGVFPHPLLDECDPSCGIVHFV